MQLECIIDDDSMIYTHRTLEKLFIKAALQFPVMLITGARQVGKTTFLRHMGQKKRAYVTFDDPLVRDFARKDPALFMQRFTPPVTIDEIQYAPELLPYIKMEADKNRGPGLFWLTGSQQFHVMKGVSESLAGRVGITRLLGFSHREKIGQGEKSKAFLPLPAKIKKEAETGTVLSLKELYRMIWRGSFPVIALDENINRDLFYSSYVQTYLQRDIRDLAHVGDEMAFFRFLRASAARSGQLLNLADLSRDADIAPNTAKTWLSIMQASGIVYILEPYHTNITKRLVKTPKLYFLDTGLCSWLTEWSSPETLESGAMSGPILETWIMAEILKSWWHNGLTPSFYFYRDKDQKEVDLLIVKDNVIHPVEFKKSASPGRDSVRHFASLKKLGIPIGPGGVICLAQQYLPLTEKNSIIPVHVL
jgi:predicted AAA+ superfamily ATPase